MNIQLLTYYAIVAVTAITRGAIIVALSWFSYEVSHDVTLVNRARQIAPDVV